MRHTMTRRFYFAALILAALGSVYFLGFAETVQAQTGKIKVPGVAADQIPPGTVGPAGSRAHTVYMDGSGGKKRAAEHMNSLHAVMAAKGWTFAHLAPHMENNDLEGWWITYVAR